MFVDLNAFFDGHIDEVRIWNSAKTEAEISSMMNMELSGLESNLVAYYKMEEISNYCDIIDCSINENHGILRTISEFSINI